MNPNPMYVKSCFNAFFALKLVTGVRMGDGVNAVVSVTAEKTAFDSSKNSVTHTMN
ncbi:hypothetical protein HMPREF0650_2150 [Hoylesella buccalis ATCC 35310]|uniref:Uncharacterized protein n=1 Tax=Hoylesella buccalis ATCC 35310 TaxID=679190 RepID=D1W4S2_9BACT|nr:hypothetical protein HMPREF0650_2150 [Hoylesella buccalis ATCC 35310]